MYKTGRYLLLPLMLVNITTAANLWTLLGIPIGQALYWILIGLSFWIASNSPYRLLVTAVLLVGLALRVLEALQGGVIFNTLRVAALAVVFIVAGAKVYGRNPDLLHKQFVIFLALCLPVMFLQILGVSSLVMGWNTELAHDAEVLTPDEYGTFRDVPLYPTLFVEGDELQYSIGQGRPVGLLYSNNVLSVFVSIAVALNLTILRSSRLRFSDIVVTGAVVLTMSKTAFAVTFLLYLGALLFGTTEQRKLVWKLFVVLAVGLLIYYLLFPGLLEANFSERMIIVSAFPRVLDLINTLGLRDSFSLAVDMADIVGTRNYQEDESYSMIGILLKSDLLAPILFIIAAAFVLYVRQVRQMSVSPVSMYVVTLFVCALTLVGVPYAAAPSFQLVAGFALFPLFKKMWPHSLATRGHGRTELRNLSESVPVR